MLAVAYGWDALRSVHVIREKHAWAAKIQRIMRNVVREMLLLVYELDMATEQKAAKMFLLKLQLKLSRTGRVVR